MGSSVAFGTGAPNNQGYAYLYDHVLQSRYQSGLGLEWQTSNISIGGNNTTNLLDRWERDLLGDCSDYVIYGLSLGNEGIHENGQPAYDSYRDNMIIAINRAREMGKIPVITNNYTRGDFNATDYNYVKQLNLLIHEWDLPSVNFLGAIDDGAGRWASGYMADNAHPNTEGHRELFYAIVPSLFDALDSGKPQPQRQAGASCHFDKSSDTTHIEWTPENTVHPFTLSFDFKTTSSGVIASLKTAGANRLRSLTINEDGKLAYNGPTPASILSASTVTDGEWQNATLTHYYAQGKTCLYLNGVKVGEISEKVNPGIFYLNDSINAPESIDYRQLFFYRSALNTEEVQALNAGKMLQSSLEIYAPLDKTAEDALQNFAQSTNTLQWHTSE
jgi:lysophospholipase L1-like esterase